MKITIIPKYKKGEFIGWTFVCENPNFEHFIEANEAESEPEALLLFATRYDYGDIGNS